jgi:hypothetical protein
MVYPEFIVSKPANWMQLAMYQKIKYYSEHLNEHYAKYVDKIQAKQIIKEICGDEIKTANILHILKHPNDITKDRLIDRTIIKSAHGSGWNIIIPRADNADIHTIHHQLNKWNRIYSISEKQYSFLKPTFFIEETIDDKYYGKDGNAVVYLVRCIRGKAIAISVNLKHVHKMCNYDMNWEIFYRNEVPHIAKPVHLDKIIKYAELLSTPFEFVRVDFYVDKNDDIYFSEFTFTPKAGNMCYTHEIEKKMGDLWI